MNIAFKSIQSLFPTKIEGTVSEALGSINDLYPEEQELIKHAVEKRQNEFAAGRLGAKEALDKIGITNFPILKDPKGAPIWPSGVCGSISHSKGCCIAIVARVNKGESLGLDIERIDRLEENLWDHIFGEEEIKWLENQGLDSQRYASVLFTAKEAFYKAQYLLTHSWVGFKDVVIELETLKKELRVNLLIDVGKWQKGSSFLGKYDIVEEYAVSGIWIESEI